MANNDDLHNLEDALKELEGKALHTSVGTYFKKEDVEKIMRRRQEAEAIQQEAAPVVKNIEGARRLAAEHLRDALKTAPPGQPGRSIPAN